MNKEELALDIFNVVAERLPKDECIQKLAKKYPTLEQYPEAVEAILRYKREKKGLEVATESVLNLLDVCARFVFTALKDHTEYMEACHRNKDLEMSYISINIYHDIKFDSLGDIFLAALEDSKIIQKLNTSKFDDNVPIHYYIENALFTIGAKVINFIQWRK